MLHERPLFTIHGQNFSLLPRHYPHPGSRHDIRASVALDRLAAMSAPRRAGRGPAAAAGPHTSGGRALPAEWQPPSPVRDWFFAMVRGETRSPWSCRRPCSTSRRGVPGRAGRRRLAPRHLRRPTALGAGRLPRRCRRPAGRRADPVHRRCPGSPPTTCWCARRRPTWRSPFCPGRSRRRSARHQPVTEPSDPAASRDRRRTAPGPDGRSSSSSSRRASGADVAPSEARPLCHRGRRWRRRGVAAAAAAAHAGSLVVRSRQADVVVLAALAVAIAVLAAVTAARRQPRIASRAESTSAWRVVDVRARTCVTLIPGDGTGPELAEATRRVLEARPAPSDRRSTGTCRKPASTSWRRPALRSRNRRSTRSDATASPSRGRSPRRSAPASARSTSRCATSSTSTPACARASPTPASALALRQRRRRHRPREHRGPLRRHRVRRAHDEADEVIDYLNGLQDKQIREGSGISIKPMSEFGSERIIRYAFEYARNNGRKRVHCVTSPTS